MSLTTSMRALILMVLQSVLNRTTHRTGHISAILSKRNIEHLLTELPKLSDEKGNIDTAGMEQLLPWYESLPKR